MPALRFNKNAPYGEVYGAPGVTYSQNGCLYNSDYFPVDLLGQRIAYDAAAPAPVAAPAPPPKKGKTNRAAPPPVDEDTPEDEKPLDLEGWVAGTKNYDFQTVKAYVSEKTNSMPEDKDDVMELASRIISGEFDSQ